LSVEEIARKMYCKSLMVKFLPEIKAIEKGKLKALKGKEIEKFLKEVSKKKLPKPKRKGI